MSYRPLDSASFAEGDLVQQVGGLLTGVDIGKVHEGVRLHSAGTVTAYPTITAALAAAVASDTVIVGPGTYNESITIPDGVRVVGTAPAQEVIIAGADATSTRVTFGGTCTLREVTVVGPSAGANPAIDCTLAAGKLGVIFAVVVQGGGGTGPLVLKDGAGIGTWLGGLYHNGGATTGPFMRIDDGLAIVQQVIANVGSCSVVCDITGGAAVEGRDWLVQSSALYSCTDMIRIAGAGSEVALTGLQSSLTNPAATNAAVKVESDDVELRLANCDLHGQTYDWEVDGALTGVNTHLDVSGCHFRYGRLSYPVAFTDNAEIHALFFDDADQNDPAYRVLSEFSVGTPELPKKSAFGEGDSSVFEMQVWSFDGTATWVDNTEFAKSSSGSSFNLFQGTGVGNIGYIGSLSRTFNGFKLDCITAMVLGGGTVVAEYWNGAWTPFTTASTLSARPFTAYANAFFQRAQNEQMRFDSFTMSDDWAMTAVNGVTAYWIRFRVTGAITTVPAFERFKLGTNRTEINTDGTIEYFGTAQQKKVFWRGTGQELSAPSSGANSPANLDVSISANVSYRQPLSSYASGSDNRHAGTMIQVPGGLDTSKPITFDFSFYTDGTNVNPVRWDVYVVQIREGDAIGALTEDLVTITDQPSGANAANEIMRASGDFYIEDLVPGDFFAFMLYRRGATDANTDTAGVTSMEWSGYFAR